MSLIDKASRLSPLMKAMRVSADGMWGQGQRILIIAQNLAGASTHPTSPNEEPYARKTISFKVVMDHKKGYETLKIRRIGRDRTPFPEVYSPGDPAANEEGYVRESNVKPMVELADLREANRSHDAMVKLYEKSHAMIQELVTLLKI